MIKMSKILEIITHEYFIYGLAFGFFVIPIFILLIIVLIEFIIDVFDYSNNKKDYKLWLEQNVDRKEMKD